ncbi:angiotensin-converting enzyme-like [Pollicipes pollicipes]|uniref:angiotensin-converting enzyme-like n=1 Tax=Pollicipes pollicipes TaxID=41117 RepID=UPI001884B329|nr:angiotensin-converting enzyme-like [Pollicipes pollicipes]
MRLTVAVVTLLAAAAAFDVEDLPPIDTIADQINSGQVPAERVAEMARDGQVPIEYMMDVKHSLTPEAKRREAGDDEYEYYEEEPEEPELEPESEPEPEQPEVEPSRGEPATYLEPEEAPAEPRLRAGQATAGDGRLREDGTGGGGGGSSDGGVIPVPRPGDVIDDVSALRILGFYSRQESQVCTGRFQNLYNFYTADRTLGPTKVDAEVEYLRLWREFATNATNLDLSSLDRTDLVELFMVLKHGGVSMLSDQDLRELVTAMTNLETTFAGAKICDYFEKSRCNLNLYKDVRVKLASSTNRNELLHYWVTWRNQLSRNSPRLYGTYVRLLDAAAKLHNSKSNAWDLVMYPYAHGNMRDLLSQLERIWEKEISPMYWQLHTYARYRLRERYGSDAVPERGAIPAHLLGSLEADDWSPLEHLLQPVANASRLDFHRRCMDHNVEVRDLRREAGVLYTRLGLNGTLIDDAMYSKLNVAAPGSDSVLFLPRVLDRCYSTYRKQIAIAIYPTNTTLSDYIELVELSGTVHKFNERAQSMFADNFGFPYKDREGFRGYGLDLAIGGARALAAVSPRGLSSMLGFQSLSDNNGTQLNLQMAHMLKLLPRIAASMAALRWQADVMTGSVPESEYNSKWWEYKKVYQGVSPPEARDETHFDAFADGTLTLPSYHIRRLVGGLAMFSVHKYHCRMYGDVNEPLSQCAILDNLQLGVNIRNVLVKGNSKPFGDQLMQLTGQAQLSGQAMVEQLQPVTEWLVQFNNAVSSRSSSDGGAWRRPMQPFN